MANLVTLFRLFLLLILIFLLLNPQINAAGSCVVLAFFIYMFDALDGYIARKFNCSTYFGALFDLAVDRSACLSLFFILAYQHYIPMWIPLFLLIRNHLVDAIRYTESNHSREIFSEKNQQFAQFIVSNRYMRALYAAIQGFAIGFLLFDRYIMVANPAYWSKWSQFYIIFGEILLYGTIALCFLRAAIVIANFLKSKNNFSATNS